MMPIHTSTLTTLDSGNSCKRGSIRSRESKEVQKVGLFAAKEKCQYEVPLGSELVLFKNPIHYTLGHEEVFSLSEAPGPAQSRVRTPNGWLVGPCGQEMFIHTDGCHLPLEYM